MTEPGYTGIPSSDISRLLDAALPAIAADIDRLKRPELAAVILGGGYGRGEGGVWHTPEGDRLYNDLDFFVFSRNAGRRAAAELAAALRPISEKWEKTLRAAVDFSPPKNLDALPAAADTLMYQELLRGWRPVWGQIDLARHLPAREPAELPFTEAARLLLNRGMGLLFAGGERTKSEPDPDFFCRNLNKTYLGAGDALLLAAGQYRWRGAERVAAFRRLAETTGLGTDAADRYEQAYRWKLEPVPRFPEAPLAAWLDARACYLTAIRRIVGAAPDAEPETIARAPRGGPRRARFPPFSALAASGARSPPGRRPFRRPGGVAAGAAVPAAGGVGRMPPVPGGTAPSVAAFQLKPPFPSADDEKIAHRSIFT